jgi:hypothetical protein
MNERVKLPIAVGSSFLQLYCFYACSVQPVYLRYPYPDVSLPRYLPFPSTSICPSVHPLPLLPFGLLLTADFSFVFLLTIMVTCIYHLRSSLCVSIIDVNLPKPVPLAFVSVR